MRSWIFTFVLTFIFSSSWSQTCCSGGVPLSGSVGFASYENKLYQFDLSYDLNVLNTLFNESEVLQDNSRLRTTQSIILKSGFPISDRFGVDILFTHVTQLRVIEQFGNITRDHTSGLGDGVLMLKYVFREEKFSGVNGQIGIGPKIPIGSTEKTTEQGFTYNADLQPGSGSWDLFSWIHLSREFRNRPQRNLYLSSIYRVNGKNNDYLGFTDYQFGQSYQIALGIGDQVMAGSLPVNLGLSLKHRRSLPDKIHGDEVDNTGGKWLFLTPALGLPLSQSILFSLVPDIPLFSNVDNTQLSTSFRIRASLYMTIKTEIKLDNDVLF